MLDGRGPLEPAQPRHADGARRAHAAQVVAEHVDDHRVLGPIFVAREELACECAVLGLRPAPRTRPLDRIGAHVAGGVEREERLGRGRDDRPSMPGVVYPEVEVRGEECRIAGPDLAVERPGIAGEGGLEPAGQVRLVDVPGGYGLADRLDALLERRTVERRDEPEVAHRRVWVGLAHQRTLQAIANRGEPSIERAVVAVKRTAREPHSTGRAVPRDDPVVEGEAEDRQALVVDRDRPSRLEGEAEVVPEVPDEATRERRGTRPAVADRAQPRQAPACLREWIRPSRRLAEDRGRIRGEVAPAATSTGPGALHDREPGHVAERFGGVDGRERGQLRRQALESQPRTRTRPRGEHCPARGRPPGRVDHGAIIGWTAATIGRCV